MKKIEKHIEPEKDVDVKVKKRVKKLIKEVEKKIEFHDFQYRSWSSEAEVKQNLKYLKNSILNHHNEYDRNEMINNDNDNRHHNPNHEQRSHQYGRRDFDFGNDHEKQVKQMLNRFRGNAEDEKDHLIHGW